MVSRTEATFRDGILKPELPLPLRNGQRVWLTVETIEETAPAGREAALDQWKRGVQAMDFRFDGRLPTRDELHDRS